MVAAPAVRTVRAETVPPRDRPDTPSAAPGALDRAAVARCVAGDVVAFEGLYARYSRTCLAHAKSVLVDAGMAEDAVQEAFVDLWRQAGRYDGRTTVRSWLLMLTHRRSVDRVRSEERQRTVALQAEHSERPDSRPGPEVQALQSVLSAQALRSLARLSAVKREALVLAYWGGYTQSEIAVLTGAPLGTVKTRVLAALRELRATALPA